MQSIVLQYPGYIIQPDTFTKRRCSFCCFHIKLQKYYKTQNEEKILLTLLQTAECVCLPYLCGELRNLISWCTKCPKIKIAMQCYKSNSVVQTGKISFFILVN